MRRLLALLVVLAGCTPMQWTRDGAVPPADTLQKDSASCREQAWREAQYRTWAYRPYGGPPFMRRDAFGRAFTAWPYGPSPYPFYADPAFEEARLADFCMRAKGYELVPVESRAPR